MRKKLAFTPPPASARQGFGAAFRSPQFLAAVGAPLAMVGATMAQQHYRNKEETQLKAHAFREMIDLHPHFKNRDQMEVARIYNSLHRASPGMAKDPLVAGAYVDNIIENKTPGMNSHQAVLNAVKDLSLIEKNVTDAAGNRARQSPLNWGSLAETSVRGLADAYHTGRMNSIQAAIAEGEANIKAREERHNANVEKGQLYAERFSIKGDRRALELKQQEEEILKRREKLEAHEQQLHNHWQQKFNDLDQRERGQGGGGTKTSSLRDMLRALKV
jgi:hypothetical protein